jgi:hypothetical protein
LTDVTGEVGELPPGGSVLKAEPKPAQSDSAKK